MEFHEIKAFTRKGLNVIGNPATVAIVDEFPSDEDMGRAARKLASPMTTFVRPTETKGVYDIRHFSPDGDECHVCGHATMAAVELLLRENPEFRQGGKLTMKMNPTFGVSAKSEIIADIDGDNISLHMPAIIDLQPMTDPAFYKELAAGLRVPEDEIEKPVYFAPRVRDLVVRFKSAETLLALEPDFPRLKQMAIEGKYQHEGLMGTAKSIIDGYDVINRVFLPGIDVDEDIACGSGNCSVIPYWVVKSQDGFGAEKRDFKVIYPYPPGGEGTCGGVQDLHLDVDKAEITLTGQAFYAKNIKIDLPQQESGRERQNGPRP